MVSPDDHIVHCVGLHSNTGCNLRRKEAGRKEERRKKGGVGGIKEGREVGGRKKGERWEGERREGERREGREKEGR